MLLSDRSLIVMCDLSSRTARRRGACGLAFCVPHVTARWRRGGERIAAAIAMAHFAGKLHVDKQTIDRVESAVLLSLIGGGLTLSVLGAAVYDIGRAFSVW